MDDGANTIVSRLGYKLVPTEVSYQVLHEDGLTVMTTLHGDSATDGVRWPPDKPGQLPGLRFGPPRRAMSDAERTIYALCMVELTRVRAELVS